MMRAPILVSMIVAAGILPSWPQQAAGQTLALAERPPRFLYASTLASARVEIEPNQSAVLRQIVSLRLDQATVGRLLDAIERQTGLSIVYGAGLPVHRPVTLRADSIAVGAALTVILLGSGFDVVLSPRGNVSLEQGSALSSVVQEGTISGQVTDKQTAKPLEGASVSLSPGRRSASTDADGRYRFTGVDTGSYTVRVRYIGYAPLVAPVTVLADEDVALDLALEKSAQELDQLVVTGTLVPTEVKALPTPVSVIREEEIALQRPLSVQELFRKAVPGSVGWNYASTPYQTAFSVRGSSSVSASSSSMKVFVDGVDVAEAGASQVDVNSIARMEVIRGPQAAAIYGSEAIGGVVQIFTKRGDSRVERPQVSAEAAMGIVQTPYVGREAVLRQEYKGSVRGGVSDVGYSLGVGYSHLGDWLPDGEVSRQSNPSLYGGVNVERGIVGIDISGRYYTQGVGSNLVNPELRETGFPTFSKPSYQPTQTQNQAIGARLSVTPTTWWRTTIHAGLDRFGYDLVQTRPRLTTSADTLLLVANEVGTKNSVGLTTSLQASLGSASSASVTTGVEHWSHAYSSWYALDAVGTTGTIQVGPAGVISATRTVTRNTGYFTQAQVGLHDALFLTAGLRAEENTDFGDSLGTPLLPRVGVSYVQRVGGATVKLRSSWGRAILPPSPGQKSGFVSATGVQLANSRLGPGQQQGWDAGIDATFGSLGSVSLTYFDQAARDLADVVVVATDPVLTQQYQNVGTVKNSGVELEAKAAAGAFTLQGQLGYTRSRIRQLSPTYAGDLRVGEEPLQTPSFTAGLSLTAAPWASTTVSAGMIYVGEWTNYDYIALFSCFGGTGPCRPTFRDYQMRYPSFVRMNLTISQRMTELLSGFVSVDNLTNDQAHEGTNVAPVRGRGITTGFRLDY